MTFDDPFPYAMIAAAACVLTMALRALRLQLTTWLTGSILGGAAIGALTLVAGPDGVFRFALPVLLAAAALWMRWRHVDRDYVDGLLFGTLTAAVAGAIAGHADSSVAFLALVEGAVTGVVSHVVLLRARLTRVLFSAGVTLLAIALHSALPRLSPPWTTLSIAVGAIALAAVVATFTQWHLLRKELDEEARFGVFPPEEIEGVVNPLRRLQRFGWRDREARREFVRLTTELAVRKSRQRRMDESMARLHHVEVLKLRQVVGQIVQVERSVRRDHEEAEEEARMSAKMPDERASNSE